MQLSRFRLWITSPPCVGLIFQARPGQASRTLGSWLRPRKYIKSNYDCCRWHILQLKKRKGARRKLESLNAQREEQLFPFWHNKRFSARFLLKPHIRWKTPRRLLRLKCDTPPQKKAPAYTHRDIESASASGTSTRTCTRLYSICTICYVGKT